jgi:hypothetical protein
MNGHPRLTNERYANHETAREIFGASPTNKATAAIDPTTQTPVITPSPFAHQSALGCCQKLCPALLAASTNIEIGITPLDPKRPIDCTPRETNAMRRTTPRPRAKSQEETVKVLLSEAAGTGAVLITVSASAKLSLGRVAEVLADSGGTGTVPAVDAKRDPLAAGHGMDVHVRAASRAVEQPLFVASVKTGPQQIAACGDPPTRVPTPDDQRSDPLFAHLKARALRGLIGPDGDGPGHIVADRTLRIGIGEITPDTDDPDRKTPLRDHEVLDPKGGGDPKGLGDGSVRSNGHRLVTHDISNTHTAPF